MMCSLEQRCRQNIHGDDDHVMVNIYIYLIMLISGGLKKKKKKVE